MTDQTKKGASLGPDSDFGSAGPRSNKGASVNECVATLREEVEGQLPFDSLFVSVSRESLRLMLGKFEDARSALRYIE